MIHLATEPAPVNHPTVSLGCGNWCTFNYDSLISSGISIVITIAVAIFHTGVQTIGTKFGGIPSGFPPLTLPRVTFSQIEDLMIPALTIAMLGAIALVFSRHGHEVALAVTFAAVAGSFLVSYTRARAEALGLRGDVGIGSRAERVVVITAGLVLAPLTFSPDRHLGGTATELLRLKGGKYVRVSDPLNYGEAQPS